MSFVDPYADQEEEVEEEAQEPQVDSRSAFKEARKKLTKAAFYEQLANEAIFNGGSEEDDEVNLEIREWAERQMFELLNVSQPTKSTVSEQFSEEEVEVLKALSRLTHEEVEALKALTKTIAVTATGVPVPKKLSGPSATPPQPPKPKAPAPPRIKAKKSKEEAPRSRVKPLRERPREIEKPQEGVYRRMNQGVQLPKEALAPPPTAIPFPVGEAYSAAQAQLASTLITGGVNTAQVDSGTGPSTGLSPDQLGGLINGYIR